MDFNPYLASRALPQNNIASLISGANQSMGDASKNALGAVDSLRGVGKANENELYNAKMKQLQTTPEFLNANPIKKQTMIQQASSGLELDAQNTLGQGNLFKQLGQEQQDLSAMDRLKTSETGANTRQEQQQNYALENLGLKANIDKAQKESENEFQTGRDKLLAGAKISEMDKRDKQTFQMIQGADGKWYRETVGGELQPTDITGPLGKGKKGSGLNLSTEAEKEFLNLSGNQQENMKKAMGLGVVGWVPEKWTYKDGKKDKSTGGYFVDKESGQRIVTSTNTDEKPAEKKPWYKF